MHSRISLLILGCLLAIVAAGNPASAQLFPTQLRWLWDQVRRGQKPCSFQGSVSVSDFQSYGQGREAVEHMREVADKLRELAGSVNPRDKRTVQGRIPRATELLHQLNSDFSAVEASNRTLRRLLIRNPSSEYQELEELLQLDEIAVSLERLNQELASETPIVVIVAAEADRLEEQLKRWEEGVEQAGRRFCLR